MKFIYGNILDMYENTAFIICDKLIIDQEKWPTIVEHLEPLRDIFEIKFVNFSHINKIYT